jgi:hypothetical protein
VKALAKPVCPAAGVGVAASVQRHELEQQFEAGPIAEALGAAEEGTLDPA